MAYGIKDNAFSYFLLFVYVQVFGLSPDLAGLAIFIMLIFDAFSVQGKIFSLNEVRYLFWKKPRFRIIFACAPNRNFRNYYIPKTTENSSENEIFSCKKS